MSAKQSAAARKNIKKAANAARKKTHHRASCKIRAHRARQKRRRSSKTQALKGLTRAYLIVSAK
jgi:hypothetical protein